MNLVHRISGRGLIAYIHDIVMAGVSFALALYLRLGDDIFFYNPDPMVRGGIVFVIICAVVFWISGLYRGVWRYASLNDLWAITRAVTIAVGTFLAVMFLWTRLAGLPRSIIIIEWFVLMALLGGPRFFYRLAKDRRFDLASGNGNGQRIAVLLVGAGDGAELFLRALRQASDAAYQAVGILSERADRVGRQIHGVRVIGRPTELARIVSELRAKGLRPQRLVLTKEGMDGAMVRKLLDEADRLGMTLARLPRPTELRSGIADEVEVRPVAVEDLLGRPQTTLDRTAMAELIGGRGVLVTGAGGSIGSELVRQICALAPAEIGLLDSSEHALYTIEREVMEGWPDIRRRAFLADVRNRRRVGNVFAQLAPELVFHAAALKHVPLVEANPVEGAATNVLGTVNVADTCVETGVAEMVLISTDKAVNPTSVMGATKRIGESYCQALDVERGQGRTRLVTVRFGNVLGSTGSVVPLFQRQLSTGGPLTVTHPDMTRYFMTVREAVELVLQASALDSQGGKGKIFVLDMGEPIRIMDLAEQMIRLTGMKPGEDIEIEIIGPRPGEKLFEEVFHGSEPPLPTACPGVLLAAPRTVRLDVLVPGIEEIRAACERGDRDAIFGVIRRLVPEYHEEIVAGGKRAAG